MKLNTYQFKKAPVAIAIEAVAADASATVTEFAWHDVFYAGEHIDMHGKKNQFTRNDLQQVVDNFKPDNSPLVIGHPELDAPAYGWVSGVRISEDDRLEIKADNVNVEFAKAVAAKAFPNRSVKLRKSKSGWELAHVGYLGAAPPSLEGLPWQFSAPEASDVICQYSLNTHATSLLSRLFGNLRDWIISASTIEDADKIIPKWELDELNAAIVRESTKDHLEPNYYSQENNVEKFTKEQLDAAVKEATDSAVKATEASFSKTLEDLQKRVETAETAVEKAEAEKAQAAFAATLAEAEALVNSLVDGGQLVPAQTEGLAHFMAHLACNESTEFAFAQGDKEVKEQPFAFAKRFLESLKNPKSPLGDDFDPAPHNHDDLDAKATAYAKDHNVSYAEAVVAVSGE